jgi:predicted small lipoprotein YifL
MKRLLLMALAAAVLSGCGQKGPLYLPDKKPAVVQPPAAQPPPASTAATPTPTQTPKKDTDSDSDTPAAPPPH